MENHVPLISILVLCYNNQQYIYENLKSIFEQSYPNLEVLIGDDHSSDFNAEQLIIWINKNKTPNIKKISIFEWKENLGTVENLERLREKSSGEYLFDIAADDILAHAEVIQHFYDKAVETGEEAEFLVAQVELWDGKLAQKLGDFLKEEVIELMENGTPRDLFAECSWHPCLPATNFYHRSILEKVGNLSCSYRLIEDWPTYMRLVRMNVRPIYVDMVCIKHRDGGISHGNSLHSQRTFLTYYEDLLKVYKYEVQPYLNLLTEEERERAERYFRDRTRAYYKIHLPQYMTWVKNEQKIARKEPIQLKVTEEKASKTDKQITTPKTSKSKMLLRETIKQLALSISHVTMIGGTGLLCVLCFIAAACLHLCETPVMNGFSTLFVGVGVLLLLALVIEIIVNVCLQIRHFLQRINNL